MPRLSLAATSTLQALTLNTTSAEALVRFSDGKHQVAVMAQDARSHPLEQTSAGSEAGL